MFLPNPVNQLPAQSGLMHDIMITLTGLFLGHQLRTLGLQGTKRQQRGPIQTQLPDRLDRDRKWGWGEAERPDEERLFAAWFDQTNTSKARSDTCACSIFFKRTLGKNSTTTLNVML